ncbi:SHOCT domain-containing protein [Sphingomonas sp. NFR15]|uniref:SHOCT domain-containing protein n=1 Tax=Sphingomonas sp. NFR15 TaxID=1566282 RepID=UPI00088675BA|nr:SHOCT domain-containing protein [Sphingomonas sp. NFR15]SDA15096.1 Short C-terminal domain-containing protein [Sphingomonas sp. NFR15]
MNLKLVFAAAAFFVCAPAIGERKAPPPEPTTRPKWIDVRREGERKFKSVLVDPDSAQISYSSGFQWGYLKPPLTARTYGWIACGSANAKNTMGGYAGARPFFILVDANGGVQADFADEYVSTCDQGKPVPLQPELETSPSTVIPSSKADELGKLADLKSKGVLTQAEFDAEKAKLLARP